MSAFRPMRILPVPCTSEGPITTTEISKGSASREDNWAWATSRLKSRRTPVVARNIADRSDEHDALILERMRFSVIRKVFFRKLSFTTVGPEKADLRGSLAMHDPSMSQEVDHYATLCGVLNFYSVVSAATASNTRESP